ncbi:hypothetical protein METH109765_18395 [Mesobacillus thioparans]
MKLSNEEFNGPVKAGIIHILNFYVGKIYVDKL